MKKQKPLGKLSLSKALCQAAQDHADDTGSKGVTGHAGTDGSSMGTRVKRYGTWDTALAENCHYGATPNGAHEAVIALVIDDGVPSRGHRNNIFNEKLKYLGAGIASHTAYGQCVVVDYAGGITAHEGEDAIEAKEGVISDDKFVPQEADEETKASDDASVDTGDIPACIMDQIKAMNLGSGYKVKKVGGEYQIEISSSGCPTMGGLDCSMEEMLRKGGFPMGGTMISQTVTTTTTTYTSPDGTTRVETKTVKS